MKQKPHYVYPFRRLTKQFDGMQSDVILIQSLQPLNAGQLIERLVCMAVAPAHEYQLVCLPDDTSIKLDTWEPAIESCQPAGATDRIQIMKPYQDAEHGWVLMHAHGTDDLVGPAGIEPASAP